MLSLKNGGVSPTRRKAPLLALMTPELRGLFEGTVEPVLDLLRFRDELAQKERAKGQWEGVLATNVRKLQRERALLEKLEEGSVARASAVATVQRLERKIAKETKNFDNARKAATKLRSKVASIIKRKAVGPALVVLEAPVIEPDAAATAAAASADPHNGAAASSSSSVAAAAANSKPSAPAPKKARKRRSSGSTAKAPPAHQQQPQPQRPSWLVGLFTQHADPSSVVLDFVGGASTLRGIGTTAPSLRAAVKAVMPRLGLKLLEVNGAPPPLEEYPRLQHLTIGHHWGAQWHETLAAKIAEAGLPARLQSLGFDDGEQYIMLLVDRNWPRLRTLHFGYRALGPFLDAVLARLNVVFPQLDSLVVSELSADRARKLLTLLDRGAFPSLVKLSCSSRMCVNLPLSPAGGMADQFAVLRRLPQTESLYLGTSTNLEPFAALITSGGLPNLKRLTIYLARTPGHDHTSFFSALGSMV